MKKLLCWLAATATLVLALAAASASSGPNATVTATTIFRAEFVPDRQKATLYASWKRWNPGEARRYEAFEKAVLAGAAAQPPALATPTGRMLVAAAKMGSSPATSPEGAAPAGRWWADSSPLNVPIGPNPAVHPNSQAMIDAAIRPLYGPVLDTAYGINVFHADARTPLVRVTTDRYPVGAVHQIPIPARAEATSGSDSKLGIVRADTGEAWELWLARKQPDGSWVAGSAGKTSVRSGAGFFDGSTTGSGASSLAVVRPEELAAGRIEHALTVSARTAMVSSSFVAPAVRTDGKSTHPDAIPEGARLQLDPAFDLARLPHPWMRTVARAMQEYGIYVTDRGGATAIGVMGAQSDDVAATRFLFGSYGDLNATGIKDHLRVLAP